MATIESTKRIRYFGPGAIIAAFSSPGPRVQDEPRDLACRIPDESDPGVIFVVGRGIRQASSCLAPSSHQAAPWKDANATELTAVHQRVDEPAHVCPGRREPPGGAGIISKKVSGGLSDLP